MIDRSKTWLVQGIRDIDNGHSSAVSAKFFEDHHGAVFRASSTENVSA
jgi:hypothetical protein